MKNYIEINKIIKNFNNEINVSGDKSISIRCVLLASQAIGTSRIYNLLESEDVLNSLKSIKKLGINYKKSNNCYTIKGFGLSGFKTKKKVNIYSGNSGTFARLVLGLLVDANNQITIKGDKSLSRREFSRVTEPLKKFGAITISNKNYLPVKIHGTKFLRPIKYIERIGSAQCKSAVIFAGLKTPGLTKIKARKSRDHTEILLKNLGVPIKVLKKKKYDYIEVNGLTNFHGFQYVVPGDISSSAFFIVLTLLSDNSQLIIKNVNVNKSRTGIIKILNKMNAKILLKNQKKYKGEVTSDIHIKSNNKLNAIKCPKYLNSSAIDEFLIIFLVAAKSRGVSTFKDLGELNKKESPRLDIGVSFLRKIGVKVIRKNNDVKIIGNPELKLNKKLIVKNFKKDHRVFMMSCVAALTLGGKWKIYDKDSIKSSFPNFIKLIKILGAKIN